MEFESEKFFTCPFCGESISMVLEVYGAQSYVEDCQVCCNPIQISFDVEDGEIVDIRAERAQ